jgi:hypothetical protein
MSGSNWYGFYSEHAAEEFGTLIYQLPDGREVEVTGVTDNEGGNGYRFPDKVPVGLVRKFLRKGKPGNYRMAYNLNDIPDFYFSHLRLENR